MIPAPSRRQLLTLFAAAPILTLPACVGMGSWSLTDAVRELMTLSSQRAIATLTEPGGFYDSQIARLDLPAQWGGHGGSLADRILNSALFKERLTREVNGVAEKGAARAAPLFVEAIRSISIADAAAILRGGPTAATDLLQRSMGNSLIGAMFPAVQDALQMASNPIIGEALRATSGVNISDLAQNIARQSNDAIFRAIGQEEAAIRANPQATRNPLLIGALVLGK